MAEAGPGPKVHHDPDCLRLLARPASKTEKAHLSGNCGELYEKVALKITLTGLYHIKGAIANER